MCKVALDAQEIFRNFFVSERGVKFPPLGISGIAAPCLTFQCEGLKLVLKSLIFQQRGRNGFDGGKEA